MMHILTLSEKDIKATIITILQAVNILEINGMILIKETKTIKNKNTISDKIHWTNFNSRTEVTEEEISDLENKSIKIILSEE